MAEHTRMKDFQARLDSMSSAMKWNQTHTQARMDTMMAILERNQVQSQDRFNTLEQSIADLTTKLTSLFETPSDSGGKTPGFQSAGITTSLNPYQTPLTVVPPRYVRLECPRFDGSDAMQWIFKAEQFFDFYELTDVYRLKIAAIHLDGPVVPWFQELQQSGSLTTWASLKVAILAAAVRDSWPIPNTAEDAHELLDEMLEELVPPVEAVLGFNTWTNPLSDGVDSLPYHDLSALDTIECVGGIPEKEWVSWAVWSNSPVREFEGRCAKLDKSNGHAIALVGGSSGMLKVQDLLLLNVISVMDWKQELNPDTMPWRSDSLTAGGMLRRNCTFKSEALEPTSMSIQFQIAATIIDNYPVIVDCVVPYPCGDLFASGTIAEFATARHKLEVLDEMATPVAVVRYKWFPSVVSASNSLIDMYCISGWCLLLLINSSISFIDENNFDNAAATLMAGLAPKTKAGRQTGGNVDILLPLVERDSFTVYDWGGFKYFKGGFNELQSGRLSFVFNTGIGCTDANWEANVFDRRKAQGGGFPHTFGLAHTGVAVGCEEYVLVFSLKVFDAIPDREYIYGWVDMSLQSNRLIAVMDQREVICWKIWIETLDVITFKIMSYVCGSHGRWNVAAALHGEKGVRRMYSRSSFKAFLEGVKSRSLPGKNAEMDAIHSLLLILRDSFTDSIEVTSNSLPLAKISVYTSSSCTKDSAEVESDVQPGIDPSPARPPPAPDEISLYTVDSENPAIRKVAVWLLNEKVKMDRFLFDIENQSTNFKLELLRRVGLVPKLQSEVTKVNEVQENVEKALSATSLRDLGAEKSMNSYGVDSIEKAWDDSLEATEYYVSFPADINLEKSFSEIMVPSTFMMGNMEAWDTGLEIGGSTFCYGQILWVSLDQYDPELEVVAGPFALGEPVLQTLDDGVQLDEFLLVLIDRKSCSWSSCQEAGISVGP